MAKVDTYEDPNNRQYRRLKVNKVVPNRVPDLLPESTVAVLSHTQAVSDTAIVNTLIQDQRKNKKRDWFIPHAYHCLPIVMANQYGYTIKAASDIWATWNGGNKPEDLELENPEPNRMQLCKSHFGMGLITFQNKFALRASHGINLLITHPMNYVLDGIMSMSAVVEADNLRRDFTINLKLTRPNYRVFIPEGTPIASILPIPRHYVDSFDIVPGSEVLDPDVLMDEYDTQTLFGRERMEVDQEMNPNKNGQRYRLGMDIYGNRFEDHQVRADPPKRSTE